MAMELSLGTRLSLFVLAACLLSPVQAGAAKYPRSGEIIGEAGRHRVRSGESLLEIARDHDLGYNAIVAANPGIDPFVPPAGATVTIPTAWILPDLPHRSGIVINLPELRLYVFPKTSAGAVATFPLGIGDEGTETPVGTFVVDRKIIAPAWFVPAAIRRERPELPAVVPPGAENPMGSHALGLSPGTIFIHGTNRPWGIGRRSSHGCLRLYPEDIVQLFQHVPVNTPVAIVNQPVKVAVSKERVYVEVHGYAGTDHERAAMEIMTRKGLWGMVDRGRLARALQEQRGMPVDVSRQPLPLSARQPSNPLE